MWGAIIGDLAGSIYEYEQANKITNIKVNELISKNAFFSDDTILTIAILDAIVNDRNYEAYLKLYGNKFLDYKPNFFPYFKTAFSPGFIKWLEGNNKGKSIGNGAMMRISSIGYLFNSEEEIIKNSRLATILSHDSEVAIECAKTVALIIFYARKGMSKEQIINKLNISLNFTPFKTFNYTCEDTINNCLYALFTSNGFEESIKKVISFGGATDTNACIVGSIAEALFGVEEDLIALAKKKIPKSFVNILDQAYEVKEDNL